MRHLVNEMSREKLLKSPNGNYRYLFNWEGGGWNDIWAKNLKEFKTELKRQFGNSNLKVNYNTLHKATPSMSREWDRNGAMMCN